MKLFMYAIKDRATDAFRAPIFFAAPGQANRAFSDEVNRAADDNDLYRHPDDFDVYYCGTFDTDFASFDLVEPKVFVRFKDIAIR